MESVVQAVTGAIDLFDFLVTTPLFPIVKDITQGGMGGCHYLIVQNTGTAATQIALLEVHWATGQADDYVLAPGKMMILPWIPMQGGFGADRIDVAHVGPATATTLRILAVL